MKPVDFLQAERTLAEVLRLIRLGSGAEGADARPPDADIPILDLIAMAQDNLVLWPVCRGLLKSTAGGPREEAVAIVVRGIMEASAEQAARTRDQLAELSHALAAAGISPVFLKGSAFIAESGMEPQRWRPMCDLDFLLGREELEAAVAVARSLGYESSSERFSEIHDVHFPMLLRPPDVVGLEPHVKLSWAHLPEAFSPNAFGQEARTVQPCASDHTAPRLRVPSDMHRLAHLVIHAQISSHRYDRNIILLRDLLDWHHLAGRQSIDMAALDKDFCAAGYASHFRSFAAFCEGFWFPGRRRFACMTWLGDHEEWAETTLRLVVDPRRRGVALLRDWGRMAGRAVRSPREAARMVRSLAEPRRGAEIADLVRNLFRP